MDLWPTIGSKWNSAEEVLLACCLAAAKVGFGELSIDSKGDPLRKYVVCTVHETNGTGRKKTCGLTIAIIELTGETSNNWVVIEVRAGALLGQSHRVHLRKGNAELVRANTIPSSIDAQADHFHNTEQGILTGWRPYESAHDAAHGRINCGGSFRCLEVDYSLQEANRGSYALPDLLFSKEEWLPIFCPL